MLVVCATAVHRVGLQTVPNELCPRVPLMAWNTCAFTIQAIGVTFFFFSASIKSCFIFSINTIVDFVSSQRTYCSKRTSHSLGPYKIDRLVCNTSTSHLELFIHFEMLSLLQLAGMKAIVQFSAAQRIKSSQAVIQRHFTEMLAGTTS